MTLHGAGGTRTTASPGCSLASTAGFDRLANAISRGDYQIDAYSGPGTARAGP